MNTIILQPNMFPLCCDNPTCAFEYDEEGFEKLTHKRGIIFTDCGDIIYQGFSCLHCQHTTLIRCEREEPLIDLRDFILSPIKDTFQLVNELILLKKNKVETPTALNFKVIPLFEERLDSKFSEFNISPCKHPSCPPLYIFNGEVECEVWIEDKDGSYTNRVLSEIERMLLKENETGKIEFRRLYPDIPIYRHFLTLINPQSGIEIDGYNGLDASVPSLHEVREKIEAIEYFASIVEGKSLNQYITEEMMKLNCSDYSNDDLLKICERRRRIQKPIHIDTRNLFLSDGLEFSKIGWEDNLRSWQGWKFAIADIVTDVLKDLPFRTPRKNLDKWIKNVKPGTALVVDAPMGLGKTSSIVNALTDNVSLSAVIFMPTIELCQNIIRNLEYRTHFKKSLGDSSEGISFANTDYLQEEVFFYEGINEKECLYFNEIFSGYKQRWFQKKYYCDKCQINLTCRFIHQSPKAQKSRIVVTTHSQYFIFTENKQLQTWLHPEAKGISKTRDMFIVDEDILFSQCYSPIVQSPDEFRYFSSTFSAFLEKYFSKHPKQSEIKARVDELFGLTNKPDTTTIIPPIATDFDIPNEIKAKWMKMRQTVPRLIPEYVDYKPYITNLLDVVEHGIKYGVVVQRYPKNYGTEKIEYISNLFFPNPKTYDLSFLPPHVFFDGTVVEEKFFEHKLKGVVFKHFPVSVGFQWPHTVHQNTNTDLTKKRVEADKNNVIEYLKNIFSVNGMNRHYYIHTTKALREAYLNDFLSKLQTEGYNIEINHYGDLRGLNRGGQCDVHIMLGSFNIPDALEIAMSLEFLQDVLKGTEPIPTKPRVWRETGSNSHRTYREEFGFIEKVVQAYRLGEQRQALARTRGINHKVDYYILSKDPLCYAPELPEPITTQFCENLFPPRKIRPDSKYGEVKKAIIDYLLVNQEALDTRVMDSMTNSINPKTFKTHRKKVMKEGIIEYVTKWKYAITDDFKRKLPL